VAKLKENNRHLNIQLSDNEMKLLEQFTKGIYGAKNLLIRTLLRRFFKEQGLYDVVVKERSSNEPNKSGS